MEVDSKFCVKKAQKLVVTGFQVKMGRQGMVLVLYSEDQHLEIDMNLQESLELVREITDLASFRVRKLSREMLGEAVTN